jgi:hypothetical protein
METSLEATGFNTVVKVLIVVWINLLQSADPELIVASLDRYFEQLVSGNGEKYKKI